MLSILLSQSSIFLSTSNAAIVPKIFNTSSPTEQVRPGEKLCRISLSQPYHTEIANAQKTIFLTLYDWNVRTKRKVRIIYAGT